MTRAARRTHRRSFLGMLTQDLAFVVVVAAAAAEVSSDADNVVVEGCAVAVVVVVVADVDADEELMSSSRQSTDPAMTCFVGRCRCLEVGAEGQLCLDPRMLSWPSSVKVADGVTTYGEVAAVGVMTTASPDGRVRGQMKLYPPWPYYCCYCGCGSRCTMATWTH
jgi:hypothetical protein